MTGDSDSFMGEDLNYGGSGNDRIEGHLDSEKHYGGSGDDIVGDDFPNPPNPDYLRCGSGYDIAYYNEGVDRVAADCEVLEPREEQPYPVP